ncbi:MAG: hypothetical protein HOB20_16760 [Planctomycetaceae bacterium]|nr:hypothetical protein [Planctomycetaceae bacterium]
MEFNPYESPDTNLVGEAVWSKEEQQLWQVALWQKYLMWFLLIFIISNIVLGYGYVVYEPLNGMEYELDKTTAGISLTAFVISWCVSTFSLAKMELIRRSKVTAALIIIGMLIPGFNLFVLLGINGSATNFLRRHQVRVGLFGAEMGDIRRNLKKKVGETDPDKIKTESTSQTPVMAQMALPIETAPPPMMAKIVPDIDSEESE